MPFEIVVRIAEDSQRGRVIQQMVDARNVTREEVIEQIIDAGIRAEFTDPDNFDHLFTPEVIADLRTISAEVKAGGKTYSMEEVDEHFVQKRKAWLANLPS